MKILLRKAFSVAKSKNLGTWLFLFCLMGSRMPEANATYELDRQYLLDSIGYLRPMDNLDGVLNEALEDSYKHYFQNQSRFVLADLSQADRALRRSRLPYSKVIEDRDILAEVMRGTHINSLLRTRLTQQGSQYQVEIDWLHFPKLEALGTVTFSVKSFDRGSSIGSTSFGSTVERELDVLFHQAPFKGYVTGRDHAQVTVNIGAMTRLKKDDILTIGTLDEVRTHPLLKKVVDWRITPTGRVVVEQVEEGIAFCRVLEESPDHEIIRYQKVTQIQSTFLSTDGHETSESTLVKAKSDHSEPVFAPRLGWVDASIFAGSYSRQFNSFSGSAPFLGAEVKGQLWLTKEWFSDLSLRYGSASYSQKDTSTGVQTPVSQNGGVGLSTSSFQIDTGYRFFMTQDYFGPQGWLKGGYRSQYFSLPTSTSELTGPISFNSFFVGVGGDLPLKNGWGATVDFNFRVFTFVNQDWVGQSTTGTSDVDLFFGGYYKVNPRVSIRGGLDYRATSADFSGGSSISQKTITIAPSLLYYF